MAKNAVAQNQNTAIRFFGDAYYDITNSPTAGINFTTQNFTIEAWVNPAIVASGSGTFENTICGNDNWNTNNLGYALRTGGSRKLSFVYGSGTTWNDCVTPSAVLPLNQWTHVAVTKNGGTVTIYINGVSTATQTFALTTIGTGTTVKIGENGNISSRKFNGAIDDLKFWDVVRTPAQIMADTTHICATAFGNYPNNLVAYFRMDETDNGTTELVNAIGGYNATLNGNFYYVYGRLLFDPAAINLYVDSSNTTNCQDGKTWATAYSQLGDALDVANLYPIVKNIYVAKGTYRPMYFPYDMGADKRGFRQGGLNNKSRTFQIRQNLNVIGGYPSGGGQRDFARNQCILDGKFSSDTALHIVIASSSTNWYNNTDSSSLSGFILQNASATNTSMFVPTPTVNGLIIPNNVGPIFIATNNFYFTDNVVRNLLSFNDIFRTAQNDITINNNYFINNKSTTNAITGPILYLNFPNTTIQNNVFANNNLLTNTIRSTGTYGYKISNNTFFKNSSANVSSIAIDNSNTNFETKNNLFYALHLGAYGIEFNTTANSAKTINSLSNSYFSNLGTLSSFNNLNLTQPLFLDSSNIAGADGLYFTADDGLQLIASSPGLDVGSNILVPSTDILGKQRPRNTTVDIGAYELQFNCTGNAQTLYVDSATSAGGGGLTWATAYKSLADALAHAHTCTSIKKIFVAKGTYAPTYKPFEMDGNEVGYEIYTNDQRDVTFHIRKGVEVYGGYPNGGGARNIKTYPTILTGALNAMDTAYHIVLMNDPFNYNNFYDTTVLDGFTILNGRANVSGIINFEANVYSKNNGAAIFSNGGFASITNNVIQNNKSTGNGGAIFLINTKATCSNNFLLNNQANNAGAVYATNNTNAQFFNNVCANNMASINAGAIYLDGGEHNIINNTFYNNVSGTSGFGGALYIAPNLQSTIANNIFNQNKIGTSASAPGADFYSGATTLNTFKNNILQRAVTNYTFNNASANYNLGTTSAATGNLFNTIVNFTNASDIDGVDNVLATKDDGLNILTGSTAMNAGNNSFATSTDITNNERRFNNSIIDIGAYEYTCSVTNTVTVTACGSYSLNTKAGIKTYTTSGVYVDTFIRPITFCDSMVTTNLTINAIPTITIAATSTLVCSGAQVTLTASGASTYLWSNAAATNVVNVSPSIATTYSVTGTSSNGCTATSNIQLLAANPILPAVSNYTYCSAGNNTISATNTASTHRWYYLNTDKHSRGNTSTLTENFNSVHTYYVSNYGIIKKDSLSSDNTSGSSNEGVFFPVTAVKDIRVTSINAKMNGIANTINNVDIYYRPNNYQPLVGNLSNNGWIYLGNHSAICNPSGFTRFNLNSEIDIPAGQTFSFHLRSTSFDDFLYSIGTGVGNVAYSNNDLQLKEGHGGVFGTSGYSPRIFKGDIVYTLGCETPKMPVTVNVNAAPTLTITPSKSPLCVGESTILTVSGAITYTWGNGATTTAITVSPISNTIYTVTGIGSNGCVSTSTYFIPVSSLPNVSANASNTLICNGASVTLSGSGTIFYTWSNGVTNNVPFTPTASATYTVTGSNYWGCSATNTITVNIDLPTITASSTVSQACPNYIIGINATGGISYSVSDGLALNIPRSLSGGNATYTITGTNAAGCTNTASVTVIDATTSPIANNSVTCSVNGNGAATLTVTNPGPQVLWFGSNTNTHVLGTGTSFTNTYPVGNHTVYVANTQIVSTSTAPFAAAGTTTTNAQASIFPVTANANLKITALADTFAAGAQTVKVYYRPNDYTTNNTGNTSAGWILVGTQTLNPTTMGIHTITLTNEVVMQAGETFSFYFHSDLQRPRKVATTANTIAGQSQQTSLDLHVKIGNTASVLFAGTISSSARRWEGKILYSKICISPLVPVNVTVIAPNAIAISTSANPICAEASSTLTATGAVSYLWNTSETTDSIIVSPIATNTYTVTGITANGCSATQTFTQTVTPLPNFTITPTATNVCAGDAVTINAIGATNYTCTNAPFGIPFVPTATTQYIVFGESNGCSTSKGITIDVNPLPTVQLSAPPTCLGQTASLTSSITSPAENKKVFSRINVSKNIPDGLASGAWQTPGPSILDTIAVTGQTGNITNANDVFITLGMYHTFSGDLKIELITPNNSAITLMERFGSNGPGTYGSGADLIVANPITFNATASDMIPIINPIPSNNYLPTAPSFLTPGNLGNLVGQTKNGIWRIRITDNTSDDTGYLDNWSIAFASPFVHTISGPALTGAITYAGTFNNNATRLALPTSASNIYTTSVTDINGCVGTSTGSVLLNPLPTVTASGPQFICTSLANATISATLSASGATTYQWSGGASGQNFGATVNRMVTFPTSTFTVAGTDANGCTQTSTVKVDLSLVGSPTINGGLGYTTTLCEGSTVTLTASINPAQTSSAHFINWSHGIQNGIAFVPPVGTTSYTMTPTNALGCVGSILTATIKVNPRVTQNVFQSICQGSSYTLTTKSGLKTYTIAGIYKDTFIHPVTSCDSIVNTTLTILVPSAITITGTNTVCATANLTANGASTYTWQPGSLVGASQALTPMGSIGTYTVTGTNANGCTASSTVVVYKNTFTVTAYPMSTMCTKDDVTAIFKISSTVNANYTYNWSLTSTSAPLGNGSGISTTTDTYISHLINPNASVGNNNVTIIITGNGCQASQNANLVVTMNTPIINVVASNNTVCANSTVTLTASGATSYTWLPSNTSGNSKTILANTSTIYTVTSFNGPNGACPSSTTILINVNPVPIINASASATTICAGSSVILNGSGATNYTWSGGVNNNTALTPSATATYTVTGTSANGCTSTSSITITVNPLPIVTAAASDTTICVGSSLTLIGSGATSYSWSGGVNNNTAFTPNATATYTVIGTNAIGCTNTSFIQINIATPSSPTNLSTTACTSFTLPWNTIATISGNYSHTYTNTNGCDSVVNYSVTIHTASASTNLSATACTSFTLPWNTIVSNSGNYSHTYTNVNGCDSVVNYSVTIHAASASTNLSATACTSFTLPWNTIVSNSGNYSHTYTNVNGCDSVVNYSVTIHAASASTNLSATACTSFTLPWNTIATISGNYSHTYTNVNGCDSVVNYSVTIHAASASTNLSATACTSYTLPWNTIVSNSGNYSHTYTNINGCDSVVNYSVTIHAASASTNLSATACTSYTLPWNTIAPISGNYSYTYTNENGCDSVVNYSVTIHAASASTNLSATACTSYTLPWNTIVSNSGNYSHTYTNVNGCDSVVNYSVTIIQNTTTTIIDTGIFEYILPWGITVNTSNVYSHTYTNIYGCDSIVNFNITIKGILLQAKVFLAGSYISSLGLMTDSLRVLGIIPTTEPYSSAPYNAIFTHVNGGGNETILPNILTVSDSNAIVDWVFVQVRSKTDSSIVVATRSALLQRDGDVVDVDGVSPLEFPALFTNQYFVSIKHRNHLGIMTASFIELSNLGTSIDFTNVSTPLFTRLAPHHNPSPLTGSAKIIGGKNCMYAGNCNIGGIGGIYARFISYSSLINSDRTSLLSAAGNTGTVIGYSIFDVDLNGYARFNGLNPDRNVILNNCANTSNTITVREQTPN
jgi:subtilisin-like proprotein convertase family protein